ncbi:MAG TPA: hypothetical protein VF120_05385 [Ktedonobacterales bacterium]
MDRNQCRPDIHSDNRPDELNAWLRVHLGRQLTVALIAPGEATNDEAHSLMEALAVYREIRVLWEPSQAEMAYLDTLSAIEPEVVLIWTTLRLPETTSATIPQADGDLHTLLGELDGRGVLDRAFVALIGPGITREGARRVGFEDGFSAAMDLARLATELAHEGVAVNERRRRGSSPPCYL